MIEELIAFGAVVGAAMYVTWRLMPAAVRTALAGPIDLRHELRGRTFAG